MLATVNLHKIKLYSKKNNKKVKKNSLDNLKDNKTKCFSKKSQNRLLQKTEAFLSAYKRSEIVFCTLTLPSGQVHTDIFIKTTILNNFFEALKKEIGEFNYVWKAEKQKNENIHFHFLTHKKFHYSILRNVWNKVLSRYGYIDAYAKKMRNTSYAKYREDIKNYYEKYNKKFSEKQCYLAYKKGVNENWQNPNSTDIKMLKNIKSVCSYICKYMKKDNKDKIQGRFWGASDKVKQLKKLEIEIKPFTSQGKKFFNEIMNLVENEAKQIIVFDYCTVYLVNILKSKFFKQIYYEYGKRNKEILKT